MQKSPRTAPFRAIANSGPTRTMFIVSRPQPCSTNSRSAGASTSAAVLPGSYASRNAQKPSVLMRTESRTDSSSATLLTARARSNSMSKGTSSALWLRATPHSQKHPRALHSPPHPPPGRPTPFVEGRRHAPPLAETDAPAVQIVDLGRPTGLDVLQHRRLVVVGHLRLRGVVDEVFRI